MVPPMLTASVDSILLRILEMKVLHNDAFIDNKHQLFLTVSCSLLPRSVTWFLAIAVAVYVLWINVQVPSLRIWPQALKEIYTQLHKSHKCWKRKKNVIVIADTIWALGILHWDLLLFDDHSSKASKWILYAQMLMFNELYTSDFFSFFNPSSPWGDQHSITRYTVVTLPEFLFVIFSPFTGH